jgi:hypothetical protein
VLPRIVSLISAYSLDPCKSLLHAFTIISDVDLGPFPSRIDEAPLALP